MFVRANFAKGLKILIALSLAITGLTLPATASHASTFAGISSLISRYTADSLNLQTDLWTDLADNSPIDLSSAAGSFSGTLSKGTTQANTNGTTSVFNYINGTTSDFMIFPKVRSVASGTGPTVAYLARYSNLDPSTRKRILTSTDDWSNIVGGFHDGRIGRVFYGGAWQGDWFGDSTYVESQFSPNDWALVITSMDRVRINGIEIANAYGNLNGSITGFGINAGAFSAESSDFQLAEFMEFDENLSTAQLLSVEDYFAATYGLTLGGGASTPTPSSSPSNTPTPTPSATPSPTPSQTVTPAPSTDASIPGASGMVARYRALDFDASAQVWPEALAGDIAAQISVATASMSSGLFKASGHSNANGSSATFEYVSGSTSDWLMFPQVAYWDHTVVYVGRYSSTNPAKRKRLISSWRDQSNAAIGFHDGLVGVTYYVGSWIAPVDSLATYQDAGDWALIVSSQNSIRANGRQMGSGSSGNRDNVAYGINASALYGIGGSMPEVSDFEIADYMIFDHALGASEIASVEANLSSVYGLTLLGDTPAISPTPTPTPSPTATNTPTPSPTPTPTTTYVLPPEPANRSEAWTYLDMVEGLSVRFNANNFYEDYLGDGKDVWAGTRRIADEDSPYNFVTVTEAQNQLSSGLTLNTHRLTDGDGASGRFKFVEGSASDWAKFPDAIAADSQFSVVYVARYSSTNQVKRKRILTSNEVDDDYGNATFGFWNGVGAVNVFGEQYLVNEDVAQKNLLHNSTDWMIVTVTGEELRVNGYPLGNPENAISHPEITLGINANEVFGVGGEMQETSDFEIADLMVFDHSLSSSEAFYVEQGLSFIYGIEQFEEFPALVGPDEPVQVSPTITASELRISWHRPNDLGTADLVSYEIEITDLATQSSYSFSVEPSFTTVIIPNGAPVPIVSGHTYSIRVRAETHHGLSEWSTPQTVTYTAPVAVDGRLAQATTSIKSSVKKGKFVVLPLNTKQGQSLNYRVTSGCKISKEIKSQIRVVGGKRKKVKVQTAWLLSGSKKGAQCSLTISAPGSTRYKPYLSARRISVT